MKPKSTKTFAISKQYQQASQLDYYYFVDIREDFEMTGISTLVTVGVRDIQGEGFPDQFSGLADSVFLDLPQPLASHSFSLKHV
ncbi:hypothetical protein PVK06_022006 [Gossypium arboreum]|uniref:tRNA (adenine(58)-N(1))-methyltransferase catalytic subunit TRM61 C-terminal domain-containing protein n=1 Tax=Gossypium arboreum TaxID=29729 RepID=A0ABR0PRL7_GOSAR|nr:hypothetical protein PVK06_022006 [Gossypium arboreum]